MDFSAVQYAQLVGKYVRMERKPDEVEWLEARATYGSELRPDYTVGAEGTVAAVWDSSNRVGGRAVEVMMDYGMGFPIFPDEEWTFRITDSQETMKTMWS